MSYLLETLGRGLLGELRAAFADRLPACGEDELEELRRQSGATPATLDAAVRLGAAYLHRQRPTEARHAFEAALELAPRSARPALGLACVCDELGQPERTFRYLALAQAHDPDDAAVAFAIGYCQERQGGVDAARASYLRAVELCPRLRNAHERLAALAVTRGDFADAVHWYERLAVMEPGDLDVLLALATLYLQCGRAHEAQDHYQRALVIEPDFADEPLPEPSDLSDADQLSEAIQTLEGLVQKYPGVAPFHVHLGDLYAKAGHETRAAQEYRCALETHPDLLEATVKLGTQHLRQQRYVDAAQTFNRAIELNDRLMLAFVGLGVSQEAAGSRREALATFDLAASLEPSTTLLFAEAARLHLKVERRQTAPAGGLEQSTEEADEYPDEDDEELLAETLRRHQQALEQNPHHADLHYRHGLLLRQVGEYDRAIAAFRQAVSINPGYAKALIKLGICLKETGRTEEAIEVFQRALRLDRRFVDVHYQLGLLFAQRNRFELAVEEFEQAVAGNAANLAFRSNLALALQNIGMLDRAAATWRSICELSPAGDAVLQRRASLLRKLAEG